LSIQYNYIYRRGCLRCHSVFTRRLPAVHYSCWRTVSGVFAANRFVVNRPGLVHRGDPGVSDTNNELNTFGVYGGGVRINVCLTKPVWVLGLTIYYNMLPVRLRCRRSFWPRAIVRIYNIYICDGETPLDLYRQRSINIMCYNQNNNIIIVDFINHIHLCI